MESTRILAGKINNPVDFLELSFMVVEKYKSAKFAAKKLSFFFI